MKLFSYNPLDDKAPKGACVKGGKVTYTLKISKSIFPYDINFVYRKDDETEEKYSPMKQNYADERYYYFTTTVEYDEIGQYWYWFKISEKKGTYYLQKGPLFDASSIDQVSYPYVQIVYNESSAVDEDIHSGIIYQIFVDRFNNSGAVEERPGFIHRADWGGVIEREFENKKEVNRQYFGGNIRGIIEKLDYLKSLNTKIIYLSPIFEANSNHKYDTADYSKIDPMFGTEKDFEELIKKADKMGMKVLLDGVFNHTGSDSIYFNKEGRYKSIGAYQSVDSPYYEWYHFLEYPNVYDAWWDVPTLPDTKEVPSFVEYIAGNKGIIEKWMKKGILGFRLDVVDELGDDFIDKIASKVRSINPKGMVLGEVWEDASIKIAYGKRRRYFLGGQLDSVTNYPLKDSILGYIKFGEMNELVEVLSYIKDQYPEEVQNNLMNIIDSHDTLRAISAFGYPKVDEYYSSREYYELTPKQKEYGKRLLKQASLIQYTAMGMPTVFYGDEAGVEGMRDPYCRVCYPWGSEDKDMLDWYLRLGEIRNNPALNGGDFKFLCKKDQVVAYERTKGDDAVVTIVNKSNVKFYVNIEGSFVDWFAGTRYENAKNICIEPDTAMLLVKEKMENN
ncbi:MAG: glycoside hydrolase family 13 protein [Clostridia bacterium]|nr:glycoside hydrolase family 13 protein [Clostridia bacterium]